MIRQRIRGVLQSHILGAVVVGALCAALYAATLAPSATWYDMAEYPAAAYFLGIAHSTGYPLYLLLGKLATFIPLGDIGYRVNLMSALFAALTVVLVYFIVWDLTRRRGAAALGALTLGAGSTLWANATQAETHALNALFTALVTYLLLAWQRTGRRAPLLAAFYTLGLAMGNHHLIQFLGPAMLVYWALVSRQESAIWESRLQPPPRTAALQGRTSPPPSESAIRESRLQSPPRTAALQGRTSPPPSESAVRESRLQPPSRTAALQGRFPWLDLPLFALLFLAGFAINLYLPLRAAQKPVIMSADASEWPIFWRMVTTGRGGEASGPQLTLNPVLLLARLGRLALFPPYELTLVGLALALGGAARLWRENRALLCYALLGGGLTFLFMLSYGIHDIYDYFLPLYVLAAICLAVGAAALAQRLERWAAAVRLRRAAPLLASLALLALPAYLAARDYPILDRSQDDSSYLYANYLTGRLEKDARLLCDFWTWAPLAYYQSLSGWRPDISVYGTLSSQSIVWEEFIPALKREAQDIYVAAGGPLPPALLASAKLHPVGIGVIETVADPSVPQPRHKDLRLPLGNLYRVVDYPPVLGVESVPQGRRLAETRYNGELALVGFGGPAAPLPVGATVKLTYYWLLDKPTTHDYYARVFLADAHGRLQLLRDLPIWDHSHLIGGLTPTSTWAPGVIMGERYDTLISWRVRPGRYTVRAWVYEDGRALEPLGSAQGTALGEIEVLPRSGPFDVPPQNIPRE